jgi:hypothetical protein
VMERYAWLIEQMLTLYDNFSYWRL